MSRVRILNLPNDTTEKELKEHFTRNVPPNAPPLEITDVMIKRLKPDEAAARGRGSRGGRGEGRGRGGRGGGDGTMASPAPLGAIRMAFVGFKSSAAGHFVVGYFNHTYFRSSKMRVELAKGLNEVGITTNMKRKMEKLQQQQQQQDDDENDNAEKPPQMAAAGGKKRPRDGADGSASATPQAVKGLTVGARGRDADDDAEGEDSSIAATRRKTRKELFIEERTQATEGPTWASEVLLPTTTRQDDDDDVVKATLPDQLELVGEDGHLRGMGEEEEEADRDRQALEKQQALGQVSDIDFLSRLGAGSSTHPTQAAAVAESHDHDHDHEGGGGEEETDRPAQGNAGEQESPETTAQLSRRVRLGNIPYTATEDQVKQFAASLVGPVEEVHIPLTKDTRQSKGAAFVKFVSGDDAVRALTLCRGAILMGRLLRVSAAEEDPHSRRAMERDARQATAAGGEGGGLAGSSEFKIRKELERRGEAIPAGSGGAAGGSGASHVSWNTMYMNSSAAVDNVAQRLGVKSDDLVSVQAKGAAVRAAIAEAYLTSEIQQVLSDEGVALDVIESGQQSLLKPRSNTTILVKNLQLAGPEEATELSKLFVRFGTLETSVFPSSGTFALFRFVHPQDARTAFARLSYKRFKNTPMFLEWAPVGAIVEGDDESGKPTDASNPVDADAAAKKHPSTANKKTVGEDDDDDDAEQDGRSHALPASAVVYTAFITNIPFTATEDNFHAFLLDACPRLARSPDTLIKRLAFQQQQGRAYLTLADVATYNYCLGRLNGKSFEGRTLSCVASKQTALDAGAGAKSSAAQQQQHAASKVAVPHDEDDDDVTLRKTAAVAPVTASGDAAGKGQSKVPPGADPHKILVKNVPFEATEADIRELFSAFSEIKSVRLPKKTNHFTTHRENNHRGFAFVEFLSATEAARAMEVLRATHLYGRHLVLQYAKLDG